MKWAGNGILAAKYEVMCDIWLQEFENFIDSDFLELFKYLNKIDLPDVEIIDLEDFKNNTINWCFTTNSEYYGIYSRNNLVGTICLSKQNHKERYASIGYEIFSKFRKQGLASKAFQLLLDKASKKGFLIVNAKIQKENEASIKIWKAKGAVFKEIDSENFGVSLKLV
jgi:RimJ/RimL family protein N-acetyltransferase